MAIAFVGSADLGNNGGSTNSQTGAFTCSAGSKRMLVVIVDGDNPTGFDDITGVTYNAVAMTLAAKYIEPAGPSRVIRNTYIYYLLNPASGANNVVVSSTNNHYLIVVAGEYTGVSASSQPDATASASIDHYPTNDISSLTTAVTSVADNCWAICGSFLTQAAGPAVPVSGTGATIRITGSTFGQPSLYDSAGPIHPAGSYSMTVASSVPACSISNLIATFIPDYPLMKRPVRNLILARKR